MDSMREIMNRVALVHNDAPHDARTRSGVNGPNGFKVWTTIPLKPAELVRCDCGWRPDFGEHLVAPRAPKEK
jgi:hypothetical protein